MLFSKDKWNNAREIKPYIQTSAALSFDKCESAFADAEELYLKKVFGTSLMDRIQDAYKGEIDTEEDGALLVFAQRAEANLAFFIQFDEMQLRLTDAGLQRQDSDTFKQAYRYQEKLIKQNYRNKGLNAIDAAISFLEKNLQTFPEWKNSQYRQELNKCIVKGADEVNDICFIENSPIIFLRLVPEFKNAELLDLTKIVGHGLYNEFKNSLAHEWEYINNDPTLMLTENFRVECARYVICKGVASLIRKSGSITDRGLYFGSDVASSVDPENLTPADSLRVGEMASQFEMMADRFKVSIESSIEVLMPRYFGGHASDVLKRDNKDKKTFWA